MSVMLSKVLPKRGFFKKPFFVVTLAVAILILIVATLVVNAALRNVDHLLILHFDGSNGIDSLGTKGQVYGILFMGYALCAINLLLSIVLNRRNVFVAYFFSFFNVFVASLILIGVGVIISVNQL